MMYNNQDMEKTCVQQKNKENVIYICVCVCVRACVSMCVSECVCDVYVILFSHKKE